MSRIPLGMGPGGKAGNFGLRAPGDFAGDGGTGIRLGAFAVSIVWISFSYSGWNAAAYVAGEVREPQRNLSRSLFGGAALVMVLYIGLNAVFLFSAPQSELVGRANVGAIAAEAIGGTSLRDAVSALVALALFTSISGMVMAGPRVYAKMAEDLKPLVARMEAADQVHITAPGTDLRFSIKDIPVVPCAGECNIPDGECFTAPVKESVNGTIKFNTQSRYQGVVFDGIEFELKDGRIEKATCANAPERLNRILDRDDGARYIGEWSFGTNNRILHPMLDTLFDEKIGGSFHFTPGNAYDDADNGNRSKVHWDLVLIQRADYGGGEISFDGELIRKDGFFVPDDLQPLNEGLPQE